jgi:hypothetical protein
LAGESGTLNRSKLPLHLAKGGNILLNVIEELGRECPPPLLHDFRQAVGWICDPSRYNRLELFAPFQPIKADISDEDIEHMRTIGLCDLLQPHETPRCWLRLFAVPEWRKQRRRIIGHTQIINDIYDKSTCRKLSLINLGQLLASTWKGRYCAHADFQAYYNSINVPREVSLLHCFQNSKEQNYCMTVAVTGQRQTVEVAQSISRIVFHAPCESPAFDVVFYDNWSIADEDEAKVRRVAGIVKERAERAGAVFSEFVDCATHQDLLGVIFDRVAKTVCVRDRTIHKLRDSWKLRDTWTCRHFAAHIGTLAFCSVVLKFSPCHVFYTLKNYCRMAQEIAVGLRDWDSPFQFWKCVTVELEDWTQYCIDNKPVQPRKADDPYQHLIIVDACPFGGGAIHWCLESNRVSYTQFYWGLNAQAPSSEFETEMARIAIFTFLNPHHTDKLLLLSDNAATVQSFSRERSSNFHINRSVSAVLDVFTHLTIDPKYIEGDKNVVADHLSRGGPMEWNQEQLRHYMALAGGGDASTLAWNTMLSNLSAGCSRDDDDVACSMPVFLYPCRGTGVTKR